MNQQPPASGQTTLRWVKATRHNLPAEGIKRPVRRLTHNDCTWIIVRQGQVFIDVDACGLENEEAVDRFLDGWDYLEEIPAPAASPDVFMAWIEEQVIEQEQLMDKENRKQEPYAAYYGAWNMLEQVKEKYLSLMPAASPVMDLNKVAIEALTSGDQDKPFLHAGNKSFSRKQLISAIEKMEPEGEALIKNLISLTIDLISRGKIDPQRVSLPEETAQLLAASPSVFPDWPTWRSLNGWQMLPDASWVHAEGERLNTESLYARYESKKAPASPVIEEKPEEEQISDDEYDAIEENAMIYMRAEARESSGWGEVKRAYMAGAQDYLRKPIESKPLPVIEPGDKQEIPDAVLEQIIEESMIKCPSAIPDEYGAGLWRHGYCARAKEEYHAKYFPELSEKQKNMMAFALFSVGMKLGPPSFGDLEDIVIKAGITAEFEGYAKQWIDYAERKKEKI